MTRILARSLLALLIVLSAGSGLATPPARADGTSGPGVVLPAPAAAPGGRQSAVPADAPAALTTNAAAAANPLCRLGVGVVSQSIAAYPLAALQDLRAGWYETWDTNSNPPHPNGMTMVQTINLHQWKWENNQFVLYSATAPYAVPYIYQVSPSLADLPSLVKAAPGSLWLVGNEIERRDWVGSDGKTATGQNEILPELYAQAYHDVYRVIKSADPTAQVANGSVIVPTPLRLQYLSRVWAEYQRRYGTTMPVDVWNIHVYMGPEIRNHWGIDIPAGIDNVQTGMWVFAGDPNQDYQQVIVNKDVSLVPGLVNAFRTWLRDRGQQNKPLIITEFGVNMPDWVWPGEFTPENVRDQYMVPGLTYLQTAADPGLGYPADENRLVQAVNWYSLDADNGNWGPPPGAPSTDPPTYFYQSFNGNLLWSGLQGQYHSPNPMGLSILGGYWKSYVQTLPATVNLRGVQLIGSAPITSSGTPVTAQVSVVIANSGSNNLNQSFTISLFDGTKTQLLGSVTVNGLAGCGQITPVAFTVPNLLPGYHPLAAQVDSANQVAETTKSDNWVTGGVFVGTASATLPLIGR